MKMQDLISNWDWLQIILFQVLKTSISKNVTSAVLSSLPSIVFVISFPASPNVIYFTPANQAKSLKTNNYGAIWCTCMYNLKACLFQFHVLYFISFIVIVAGLIVYSIRPAPVRLSEDAYAEVAQVVIDTNVDITNEASTNLQAEIVCSDQAEFDKSKQWS